MTKAKPLPPLELVEQLLDYDPETGVFKWKISPTQRIKIGSKAGQVDKRGYIKIKIKGSSFAAHRLAWLMSSKKDPLNYTIDHMDGNKENNSISNLRLATRLQNNCNVFARKSNTSGFKGVSFKKATNKWSSNIRYKGKQYYLGYFDTPELAHMAYCKAAAELHGEFARAM